jgi:hypothetical protein
MLLSAVQGCLASKSSETSDHRQVLLYLLSGSRVPCPFPPLPVLAPSGQLCTFSSPLSTGMRKRTSGRRLWYRSRTRFTNSGEGGTEGG